MADNKKISIRLGIDGADGVKATLTAVGNDGSKALERISDAAQAIAPSLSSMTTAMREASRGFPSGGTNNFDIGAKSAAASARAMEAALAAEKRSMQAMLDAADPAAAALRRIAQAETEANRAFAHGSITKTQHETIMRSLAAGTETASRGYSRFGMVVQQAGFQLSDIAAVAASGGNVLSTVGVQLGQFVGFLGPMGAVVGIAVTALGALAHYLLESGSAAEDAKHEQDAYNDSLKAVIELEKDYQAAHRESLGMLPINNKIELLKKQAELADFTYQEMSKKTRDEALDWKDKLSAVLGTLSHPSTYANMSALTFTAGLYGSGNILDTYHKEKDAIYNRNLRSAEAARDTFQSDLRYGMDLVTGADADKLKIAIQKLNEERQRENDLMRTSVSDRERNRAMMEAELKMRAALEKFPASNEEIDMEVAKTRAQAASVYDQKQREEASKKQSDADNKATEAIRKQIEVLQDEGEKLRMNERERAVHIELMKAEQAMRETGRSLSQETVQQIQRQAEANYDLKKSQQELADAIKAQDEEQKKNQQEMRQFSNQLAANMTSAFEQAVFAGKDLRGVFSGLLDDMAKVILRATVMKPLMNWAVGGDSATGGGGFLGNIFGSIFHQGGVVGGAAPQRAVPISAFAGAPRYHGGGIAGLNPDEVPAILQRGEVVLPRRATQASGGASVTIIQNNTIQIPASAASAKENSALIQQITSQLATVTKAVVMQVLVDQKRAGGLLAT